jgi:NAD-dependent deacetylase
MPVAFPPDLIRRLRQAHAVAVLTGAGISAESGIPTFRDPESGIWTQVNPEDVATREAFRRDPARVWAWYARRRTLAARATPNAGHLALAQLEAHVPWLMLITQNVDGLHQRAGSRSVVELHGNLGRTKCFRENVVVESWEEAGELPPACPRCGGPLRPDVVWFGELLPAEAMGQAIDAARGCQVFFSIGTSGLVEPAASLVLTAWERGAMVIEINPEATPLSPYAACALRGPAGHILPELVRSVWH